MCLHLRLPPHKFAPAAFRAALAQTLGVPPEGISILNVRRLRAADGSPLTDAQTEVCGSGGLCACELERDFADVGHEGGAWG